MSVPCHILGGSGEGALVYVRQGTTDRESEMPCSNLFVEMPCCNLSVTFSLAC